MQVVATTTIYWLVAISLLTAIVASYVAFGFAERMASSKGHIYLGWLGGGASAMGLGIWSMHYLGMLSVQLPIEVVYHLPTVLISLVLAVFAAAVALVVMSRTQFTAGNSMLGSLLMGTGIGGMHYTGMHAMRCHAMHSYRPLIVLLSVIVAVSFSWLALWIAFHARSDSTAKGWRRLGGAILMGLGIAAMHYTAMAAVTFRADAMPYPTAHTVHINIIGIFSVALTTSILLLGSMVTTLFDRKLNELLALHEQLLEERDRFHAAAESNMDSLFICSAIRDKRGDIEDFTFDYLNSNVEKMVAIPRSQMLGGRMCELLPHNVRLGLFERYKYVVDSGESMVCELAMQEDVVLGGWLRIQAVKVRDGVAITAADITDRKRNEQRILQMAHHDPLTGLLNRSLLRDRLSQAVDQAMRSQNMAAVYLIDLDKFKHINDTLGHAAGDCVLVTVASRLTATVRAVDSIIRVGGDEFLVIMPELKSFRDAAVAAEKLLRALRPSMVLEGKPVHVTCSIGCAVFPVAAGDVDELLSRADAAMYIAKGLGKNQAHVFAPEEVMSAESQYEEASASRALAALAR